MAAALELVKDRPSIVRPDVINGPNGRVNTIKKRRVPDLPPDLAMMVKRAEGKGVGENHDKIAGRQAGEEPLNKGG